MHHHSKTELFWAFSGLGSRRVRSSASNRIIGAKDHASIQMNISEVDKVTGRVNGQFRTYAICGAIRRMGESDDSVLRLAKNDSIISKNF
uniref:Small ribosomal subunit protein eS21 n=1 Tax=Podarcis muralis TaxID=64176 RepID=A0A670JPZ4_PODMU